MITKILICFNFTKYNKISIIPNNILVLTTLMVNTISVLNTNVELTFL